MKKKEKSAPMMVRYFVNRAADVHAPTLSVWKRPVASLVGGIRSVEIPRSVLAPADGNAAADGSDARTISGS